MKKHILNILAIGALLCSCDSYISKEPLDVIPNSQSLWNKESTARSAMLGYYTDYFPGYRSGWSRSDWYSETNIADWTDDNAQQEATFFTKNAPTDASQTSWNFNNVRGINEMIQKLENSTLTDEAKNHWLGVARFLRAMEYSNLVSKYGDVPWFDKVIENNDKENLYKQRDKRTFVMDKVLDDLNFACQNVREDDGTAKLTINLDVVYAFKSRIMLFEGTWQKYREKNNEYAKKYLQEAKNASEYIIKSNKYALCPDFKSLTTSEDLSKNPEIILYRAYVEGIVTHSLMSFQNTEIEKNSPSKSLIDTYLTKNGLPIGQQGNDMYKGDKTFKDEMSNRDPRLAANINTKELVINGIHPIYAVSGYFGTRFLNESLKDKSTGKSTNCITDAPIMKLNEVMMNYIEAAAELKELGVYQLSQNDFDITINALRDRPSTAMPHVTLTGNSLSVNGQVINDPERDNDVNPVIWEIRRERRVELVYEGKRFNDIRRWNKLYYADMIKNPKINMGSWIDKEEYIKWYNENRTGDQKEINLETLKGLQLDREGNKGYIKPIKDTQLMRTYSEKDYLYPIPLDQITLYKSYGVELQNNPGW